jgi:regulator of sigma E protease
MFSFISILNQFPTTFIERVLPTAVVLSIVILLHELGHFLAAKINNVKVEEFGMGFPPRLIGKKIGETIYSLNWIPFGGFVRLFGEHEFESKDTKSPRAFFNQSKKVRSFVILAGVMMNILLGVVCFSIFYSSLGIPEETDNVIIEVVMPNSPAEQAGIERGDRIEAINGEEISTTQEFVTAVRERSGEEVEFSLIRKGQQQTITLVPRVDPPPEEGAIGVVVSNFDNVFYPWWQMPFRGAWVGIQEALAWIRMIFAGLWQVVTGIFVGQTPEVAGPLGMAQIINRVAQEGVLYLIRFMGIISINLAVINVLPFPALDGGRFVFIMLEKVIGKKMRPKIEAYVNMVGMIFLLSLMVLITVADILRIVRGG